MSHSGSQRALGRSSYSVTGALEALGYLDTQTLGHTGTQGTWVLGHLVHLDTQTFGHLETQALGHLMHLRHFIQKIQKMIADKLDLSD